MILIYEPRERELSCAAMKDREYFDKDLPLGFNDITLESELKQIKEWFEGWQGSGRLRNKARENHLEKQWKKFLEVYTLTGDSVKDFLAFLQWDNESHWRDCIKYQHSSELHLSHYFIQQNVKLQDALERIYKVNGAYP